MDGESEANLKVIDLSQKEEYTENIGIRYYWCVNCGKHGDFGFYRKRLVICENCNYNDLAELDQEDYATYRNRRLEIL
jgi:hypothetical protein